MWGRPTRAGAAAAGGAGGARGCVVLLHGLNRTPLAMARLAAALQRQGFEVRNWFYPGRAARIEEHADQVAARLRALAAEAHGPWHMVGHSLGGIVWRAVLARTDGSRPPLSDPGRLVQIAPPNGGSELARRLSGQPVAEFVFGRGAFHELAARDLALRWGAPPVEVGVIAGARGDGRGWNPWLPGDDDGVVTVAETHLPSEADHLVLAAPHTTLPWRRDVCEQVAAFLRTGRFIRVGGSRAR